MTTPFFINLNSDFIERYDMAKLFEFTDNIDVLSSIFQKELRSLPYKATYTVQGEDERPDLVSKRAYGTTQYWWIILMYNNKSEFSDITTGEVLKVPDIAAVDDLIFSLKARETARNR